jgi:hypothetical protein
MHGMRACRSISNSNSPRVFVFAHAGVNLPYDLSVVAATLDTEYTTLVLNADAAHVRGVDAMIAELDAHRTSIGDFDAYARWTVGMKASEDVTKPTHGTQTRKAVSTFYKKLISALVEGSHITAANGRELQLADVWPQLVAINPAWTERAIAFVRFGVTYELLNYYVLGLDAKNEHTPKGNKWLDNSGPHKKVAAALRAAGVLPRDVPEVEGDADVVAVKFAAPVVAAIAAARAAALLRLWLRV